MLAAATKLSASVAMAAAMMTVTGAAGGALVAQMITTAAGVMAAWQTIILSADDIAQIERQMLDIFLDQDMTNNFKWRSVASGALRIRNPAVLSSKTCWCIDVQAAQGSFIVCGPKALG
jgi:hypothetical protein